VLTTGGLHEDGLADLADGFGGGRDAAHKLAIMRDSRIGSYGALALVLALSLRVLALGHGAAALGWAGAALALIGIEAASRAGMAVMLWALPAARSDGLGKSAAGGSGQAVAVAAALGAAGLAIGFGAGPAALAVAGALAAAQVAMGALALRQIGGQSGDVLGGAQQIGAAAAWIAALAISYP
jgi:adenosylcobinamide-GDP ribazoletransferase